MTIIYNNKESEDDSIDKDEIDLQKLFMFLWDSKKLIILITSIFAIGSVAFALNLKNYYKSEAVLALAEPSNDSSMLSSISGLASMAGINLPGAGSDKSNLVIETIKSRAFLKHLLSIENILPPLLAAKEYDVDSKQLIYDPKVYDKNSESWVRKPTKNQQIEPSYLEAHEVYLSSFSITKSKSNGFILMTMDHLSPVFAKNFLNLIIKEANELLRNQDLRESSDAIDFLTSELPKSNLLSMKEAINLLVQSRLETQMMAKINADYVLKVIEPPFVPEKKFKPKRAIICILITIFGGFFAIGWVFLRHYFKQKFF